jgi:5-methylcytosine-specific restriction enzyme subunit McrC
VLDFVSRFPIEDVIQLILESQQLPVNVPDLPVSTEPAQFLVDRLVAAFLTEVERVTGFGLAKGYRTTRHLRPPYAGRLDPVHHLTRLAARPDRLATTSRRLTTDVPANGVLAAAVDSTRRMALSAELGRRAAGVAPAFARAGRPQDPVRALRAVADQAPSRYRVALGLAALILRAQMLSPRGSGFTSPSMLFSMPAVWEAYVARWVGEQRPDHRVEAGYAFPLGSRLVAVADLVVLARDGSGVVELFDAKYKWPDSAPDRPDLYQMIAYCDALGLDEATLVYPVAAPPRSVQVGRITVHVLGLPPRARPRPPASAGRRPVPATAPL